MMSRKMMNKDYYRVPDSEISLTLGLLQAIDTQGRDTAAAHSWSYSVMQEKSPFTTKNHATGKSLVFSYQLVN